MVRQMGSAAAAVLLALTAMLAVSAPAGAQPTDTLYVSELNGNRVISVPAGGGTPTVVADNLAWPRGVAVSGGTVYVAESDAGRVVSVPAGGGTPTVVAEGLEFPQGIAVSSPPGPDPCWGSVCLPPAGS